MNKLPSVQQYYSFEPIPNGGDYQLEKVSDNIKYKFESLIENLEDTPQVTLCTRGDSKKEKSHDDLFNNLLSKIFIVGEKSKSNIKSSHDDKYKHLETNNKNMLLLELKTLIKEVNNEIMNKPDNHNISGLINNDFIINLEKSDIQSLNKWKIFFLSFLHNSGSLKDFKNYSPFISMAYNTDKYKIARKFAFERNTYDKAIIYLYALNTGDPYYIQTKSMTKVLKKYGVTWYKDIHNEIMLINGMYPHYLLGIFEITEHTTPRFIINPWLYDILNKDESFDYKNGLRINQENFTELAQDVGYTNFFFRDNDGTAFISDFSDTYIEKVITP